MAVRPHLTAQEAAAALGVSLATLYAYVSRGQIRSIPGAEPRTRLYAAEDVDRLTQRKAAGRTPARAAAASLDWGLPVLDSEVSLITAQALYYRGRDVADLVRDGASFEQVAQLLWAGDGDPFAAPLPPAAAAWAGQVIADPSLAVIDRAMAALPLLARTTPLLWSAEPPRLAAAGLVLAMAEIATGKADPIDDGRGVVVRLAAAWQATPHAALIRTALVLCADHELNVSSFTVRCVASTGAHLYAAVTAGLAALGGPRHGGATASAEAMLLEMLASDRSAADLVGARLRRGDRLISFGHPLYPDGDPRARILLDTLAASDLPARHRILEIAEAGRALGGREPNIDFALAAMTRALALPEGASLAVFMVGRTAGWIAHAFEQWASGKLIRPRARYVGLAPAV